MQQGKGMHRYSISLCTAKKVANAHGDLTPPNTMLIRDHRPGSAATPFPMAEAALLPSKATRLLITISCIHLELDQNL